MAGGAAGGGATTPNFGKFEDNRGGGLRAFVISAMTISIVFVGLRFWSRSLRSMDNRRLSRFWWDDWIALAAVPFLFAAGMLVIDMTYLGLGKHTWFINPDNLMPILNRLFAVYYLYNTGLMLAKVSCLLFYTRIFSHAHVLKWFPKAIWATHTLNLGVFIGNICTISFNLSPQAQVDGNFRKDTARIWLSTAVPGAVIDLILLVLPMPMIWMLKMDRGRKIAIACVFICGYSVIVVSLGRVITIAKDQNLAVDMSYRSIPAMYWMAAEVPMTLICICLPSMMTLWRRLVSLSKQTISSTFGTHSRRSSLETRTIIVRQDDSNEEGIRYTDATHDSYSVKEGDRHNSLMMQLMQGGKAHTTTVTRPVQAMTANSSDDIIGIRVQRDVIISSSVSNAEKGGV